MATRLIHRELKYTYPRTPTLINNTNTNIRSFSLRIYPRTYILVLWNIVCRLEQYGAFFSSILQLRILDRNYLFILYFVFKVKKVLFCCIICNATPSYDIKLSFSSLGKRVGTGANFYSDTFDIDNHFKTHASIGK